MRNFFNDLSTSEFIRYKRMEAKRIENRNNLINEYITSLKWKLKEAEKGKNLHMIELYRAKINSANKVLDIMLYHKYNNNKFDTTTDFLV